MAGDRDSDLGNIAICDKGIIGQPQFMSSIAVPRTNRADKTSDLLQFLSRCSGNRSQRDERCTAVVYRDERFCTLSYIAE